jgi:hypothetical protein
MTARRLPCDRRSEAEQVDDLNLTLADRPADFAEEVCAFLAAFATVLLCGAILWCAVVKWAPA